ncbi:MAG: YodL domain-containing protein [Firmicutes bacterium]|nr:YodL domain-containing protein [Bacillota bacterium]
MKITVYQMKLGQEFKFRGYDEIVKAQGGQKEINRSLYDEVYSGEVDCDDIEGVFCLLNTKHPVGYKGHSLSISDVVQTEQGCFFCDTYGFKKIKFI